MTVEETISEVLCVDDPRLDDNLLDDLGGDSLTILELSMSLEEDTGCDPLPRDDMTVAEVIRHVDTTRRRMRGL